MDNNKAWLLKKIADGNPKTAFDVESQASLAIIDSYGTDEFIDIKNYIYQNPFHKNKKTGNTIKLDLSTVAKVCGIYLRNFYLEEHPDINPGN